MSVRCMTRVWDLDLPDSDKIVLLALADCANDEGHCWPSVASLVRKCSKSERTIQASIKRLVDSGLLLRREVLGKGCNYTVLPRTPAANAPRRDDAPAKASPPQGTTDTPAAAADKPSVTVNTEAKASYQVAIDLWNELSAESGIPTVQVLNNSRKQMINARIKEHGLEIILEAIRRVHGSKFCRGGEGARRKADIMYILQPKTLARVLEGFYGEDQTKISIDPAIHAQRKRDLADLYDKMGRGDEAAVLRIEAAALIQKCAVARAA